MVGQTYIIVLSNSRLRRLRGGIIPIVACVVGGTMIGAGRSRVGGHDVETVFVVDGD